jgi:short-subunit dehydrogenase
VNTLASLIPAPTRTIYASSKSASLLLYQALAIEHPFIKFTFFLPATIEGDFRAGAVDGGVVREADPAKNGLKREDVAKRLVKSIDWGEKTVFMPKVSFFKLTVHGQGLLNVNFEDYENWTFVVLDCTGLCGMES